MTDLENKNKILSKTPKFVQKNADLLIFTPFVLFLSFGATLAGMYYAAKKQNVSVSHLMSIWDGAYYKTLAQIGYLENIPEMNGKLVQNINAFFPTFPYGARYLDHVLPGGIAIAALCLNLLAIFFSIFLFRKCAEKLIGREKSYYATLLLFLFPGAFVFYWFYAEAVTIFFVIAAIYALSEKKVWISSILIGLATFSRPNAMAFAGMTPLFVLLSGLDIKNFSSIYKKWKNSLFVLAKVIANFLISISGFVAFMLLLLKITGEWGIWFRIEREAWGESTAPFKVIKQDIKDLFTKEIYYRNIIICTFALIGLAAIALLIRYMFESKFDPMAVALSLPSILIIILSISNNTAVASPRFTILAVPVFLVLAKKLKRNYAIVLICLCLLSVAVTAAFYSWPYNAA